MTHEREKPIGKNRPLPHVGVEVSILGLGAAMMKTSKDLKEKMSLMNEQREGAVEKSHVEY
jgi:hypothetical protein